MKESYGIKKNSNLAYIVTSAGMPCNRAKLDVVMEVHTDSLAMYTDPDKNGRPYFMFTGHARSFEVKDGTFPDGSSRVSLMGSDARQVSCRFDVTDEELSELALKGLFHEDYPMPMSLSEGVVHIPGRVECDSVEADGVHIMMLDVDHPDLLRTDSLSSGIPFVESFDYRKAPAYEHGIYQKGEYVSEREAGRDVPVRDQASYAQRMSMLVSERGSRDFAAFVQDAPGDGPEESAGETREAQEAVGSGSQHDGVDDAAGMAAAQADADAHTALDADASHADAVEGGDARGAAAQALGGPVKDRVLEDMERMFGSVSSMPVNASPVQNVARDMTVADGSGAYDMDDDPSYPQNV